MIQISYTELGWLLDKLYDNLKLIEQYCKIFQFSLSKSENKIGSTKSKNNRLLVAPELLFYTKTDKIVCRSVLNTTNIAFFPLKKYLLHNQFKLFKILKLSCGNFQQLYTKRQCCIHV